MPPAPRPCRKMIPTKNSAPMGATNKWLIRWIISTRFQSTVRINSATSRPRPMQTSPATAATNLARLSPSGRRRLPEKSLEEVGGDHGGHGVHSGAEARHRRSHDRGQHGAGHAGRKLFDDESRHQPVALAAGHGALVIGKRQSRLAVSRSRTRPARRPSRGPSWRSRTARRPRPTALRPRRKEC